MPRVPATRPATLLPPRADSNPAGRPHQPGPREPVVQTLRLACAHAAGNRDRPRRHRCLGLGRLGPLLSGRRRRRGDRPRQWTTVFSGWLYIIERPRPGVDLGENVARLPVRPGNSDLCFAWDGPIEDPIAHLERCNVDLETGPLPRAGARGAGSSLYFRDPDAACSSSLPTRPLELTRCYALDGRVCKGATCGRMRRCRLASAARSALTRCSSGCVDGAQVPV
jgi:hypothetical protein